MGYSKLLGALLLNKMEFSRLFFFTHPLHKNARNKNNRNVRNGIAKTRQLATPFNLWYAIYLKIGFILFVWIAQKGNSLYNMYASRIIVLINKRIPLFFVLCEV